MKQKDTCPFIFFTKFEHFHRRVLQELPYYVMPLEHTNMSALMTVSIMPPSVFLTHLLMLRN